LMARIFSLLSPSSPIRRAVYRIVAALLGVLPVFAGCGDDAERRAATVADAQATLAQERGIRGNLIKELKRLEGEHEVHLQRSALLTGELKPPLLFEADRSRIGSAIPSFGIRRLWRLWARRPAAMPWYDKSTGELLARELIKTYKQRTGEIEKQIAHQDRKIVEAEKYLKLVSSLDDGV
jgi:hypothetical protein